MQVTAFIASLRRVVRILWSQQLALAEGFDESIIRVLMAGIPKTHMVSAGLNIC